MNIIAVETSSQATSVALAIGDQIIERYEATPRRHGAVLLPMIHALLQEQSVTLSDIDALALSCGPGSFTGLRIGAGVVQGLGFGAQIPVLLVSSLQVLAQAVWAEQGASHVLVGWDARMGEVYWGQYREQSGWMLPLAKDALCKPEQCAIAQHDSPVDVAWVGVGDAWREYGDALSVPCTRVIDDQYPRARYVAQWGQCYSAQGRKGVPAHQALPVYLNPSHGFLSC